MWQERSFGAPVMLPGGREAARMSRPVFEWMGDGLVCVSGNVGFGEMAGVAIPLLLLREMSLLELTRRLPSMTLTSWKSVAYSSTTINFGTRTLPDPTTPWRSCRIRSTIIRFSARSLGVASRAVASARVSGGRLGSGCRFTVPFMGRN